MHGYVQPCGRLPGKTLNLRRSWTEPSRTRSVLDGAFAGSSSCYSACDVMVCRPISVESVSAGYGTVPNDCGGLTAGWSCESPLRCAYLREHCVLVTRGGSGVPLSFIPTRRVNEAHAIALRVGNLSCTQLQGQPTWWTWHMNRGAAGLPFRNASRTRGTGMYR
jgi:hypothetical protein